jgi:hypothetical protein
MSAVTCTKRRAGTSVRLTAHASGRPITVLSSAVHAPSTSELRSAVT